MERQLIPINDSRALKEATSQTFSAEEVRVRDAQDIPAGWRLAPTCTAFYNPAGMTQADMDAFDATERIARRDHELGLKVVIALATAIHKRIKSAVPTDTTTATQWEASLRAEWDALN